MTSKTLLISGASGVIGSELIPFLTAKGYRVVRLIRSQHKKTLENALYWNPGKGIIQLDSELPIYGVINLSGEHIGAGLWTAKKKKAILDSRIQTTTLLANTIASLCQKPSVFISASAIGFYGNRGDEVLTETGESGSDFLSKVCFLWENAAMPSIDAGVRTAFLRIGVVLTPRGGALRLMAKPFSLGLGARLGKGNQYMSWISMDDLIGAIYHALTHSGLAGAVNAVSPNPVTNNEFCDTLGEVLRRPVRLRAPETLIRFCLGDMGLEILLSSARVSPKKLLETGFAFKHGDLKTALRELLNCEGL
jgi:hypothetical protein